MISIEILLFGLAIAMGLGMLIGFISDIKPKSEQSQRDKDIEELINQVGKLMEGERKKK